VRGKDNTRSAWSGDGSWWAASTVRWRTPERLSHARGHNAASARGFAHGWLQLVARGACVAAGTRGAGSGEELAAVGRVAARRAVVLSAVRRRRCPKPTGVGTVALGRAQFSAQYYFANIQTLL
jgi:hypothetical protein